jgi:RNA polymerase sigma-B factor
MSEAIPYSTSTPLQKRTLALLVAYQQEPSVALRNRIVELNMGLVRRVAHRLSQRTPVPYEDLQQLGSLGLILAIERFNPQHGCAFSSFAIPYIRGEMLHYLRDHSHLIRIPRRWQSLQRQGHRIQEQLTTQLGRTPTHVEIAAHLGVELKIWEEARTSLQQPPLSLDVAVPSPQGESLSTLGEQLPDQKDLDLQLAQLDRMQLQVALTQLEQQTCQILKAIFLEDQTRKQAAAFLGVSPMTITRRIQLGISQLQGLLQS